MDLGEFVLGGNFIASPRLTSITFALAITLTAGVLLLGIRKLRLQDARSARSIQTSPDATGWLLALSAIMSFTFYKHHAYDEVVFLFPLCYALQHRHQASAKAALALIGYHWFVQRIFDSYLHFSWLWNTTRLLSFCALLACVYFTQPVSDPLVIAQEKAATSAAAL